MKSDPSPDSPKNVKQAAFSRLARDSAFELVLTFVLLFGVTSIVRWVIGPSAISRAIPQFHAELLIVGENCFSSQYGTEQLGDAVRRHPRSREGTKPPHGQRNRRIYVTSRELPWGTEDQPS